VHPGIATIYMSGYPRSLVAETGRLDEDIDYLEKPFTVGVLLARVRAALS
jgi:DNA-binding response OmpR family regulator